MGRFTIFLCEKFAFVILFVYICAVNIKAPTEVIDKATASLINGQISSGAGSASPCSGVAPIAAAEDYAVQGVSPSYVQKTATPIELGLAWFYMRVAYGQERKVYDYLSSEGIEVFHPTWKKERIVAGVKKLVETSVIPNALFVHSSADVLKQYVGKRPTEYFHHFYEPWHDSKGNIIGSGRRPIIIPDNQMQSFQIWLQTDNPNKILVTTSNFDFRLGDSVKVIEGDFKGFIGRVIRLKGQTRVGINLKGVGLVSTSFIPKYYLEHIIENIEL